MLMKVGLYCGIFLTTPVILWQLWGFVSPGLYANERRFAGPFVAFGSVAFLAGTLFCYFVLLPAGRGGPHPPCARGPPPPGPADSAGGLEMVEQ